MPYEMLLDACVRSTHVNYLPILAGNQLALLRSYNTLTESPSKRFLALASLKVLQGISRVVLNVEGKEPF